MNKKIKIYELLEMINNLQRPMPKKINCCGYEYEWDSDFQDYLRTDHKQGLTFSFLENHDDNLYCFLNDEVEILDDEDMEDKTKPLTKKDIEALGYACGEIKKCFEMGWNKSLNNEQLDEDMEIEELRFTGDGKADYTNVIPKINELVREINKLKKEGK